MVSTRYEMAKTRSQKKRQFSFTPGTGWNQDFIYPGRIYGSYNKIVSPNSKFETNVKHIPKQVKKKVVLGRQKSPPLVLDRQKAPPCRNKSGKTCVTKVVMSCKIRNKANCPAHKKQQDSRSKKFVYAKRPISNSKSERKTPGRSIVKNVKAVLTRNEKVTKQEINAKVLVRKSKISNEKKHKGTQLSEKVKKPNKQSQISKVKCQPKLSPVTFKKSTKNCLMQEISKSITKKSKNDMSGTACQGSISSSTKAQTPVSSRKNKKLKDLSTSKPMISTKSPMACNVNTYQVPTSPISNKSTNSNHSISPQTNPKLFHQSFSRKLLSILNKKSPSASSDLPSLNKNYPSARVKLPLRTQHDTRASVIRQNVVTRNIFKNCKLNLDLTALLNQSETRKSSRAPPKPKLLSKCLSLNNVHSSSRENKKTPSFNSKTLFSKGTRRKVSPPGIQSKKLQSKMINTMKKKFGTQSRLSKAVSYKSGDNLEEDLLNTSDELEAVDKFLNAKILSFKLKENTLEFPPEFPQALHKRSNALVVRRRDLSKVKKVSSERKKQPKTLIKSSNSTRNTSKTSPRIKVFKKKDGKQNISTVDVSADSTADMLECNIPSPNENKLTTGKAKNSKDSSSVPNTTATPLTLKSKVVLVNGKKVKKKLSQREQRIFNLLRVYGNDHQVKQTPGSVTSETPKRSSRDASSSSKDTQPASTEKNKNFEGKSRSVKYQKSNNKNQELEIESKTDELNKTQESQKKEKIKAHDAPSVKLQNKKQEKVMQHVKEKLKHAQTIQDKTLKERDKAKLNFKSKISTQYLKSTESVEKVTPSEKVKRMLHKAKYKILKENDVTQDRKSEKSTTESKRLKKSSSECQLNTVDKVPPSLHKLKKKSLKASPEMFCKKKYTSDNLISRALHVLSKKKQGISKDKRKHSNEREDSSEIDTSDDTNIGGNVSDSSWPREVEGTKKSNLSLGYNSESDDSISSFLKKHKTKSSERLEETRPSAHRQTPMLPNNKSTLGVKRSSATFSSPTKPNFNSSLSEKDESIHENLSSQPLGRQNNSVRNQCTNRIISEDVVSDVDIFDDSRDLTCRSQSMSQSENKGYPSRVSQRQEDISERDKFKSKERNEEKKREYKEIASEHVNKFRTQDLVQTLMQLPSNRNQSTLKFPSAKARDVGNYRDYTSRTGVTRNPIRILKRKACQDVKKQLSNEYKNRSNGKDYFQCICFNKFFITRVENPTTHNFDILNVKVKPNKHENVVSLHDVQFCTFCSRLYEKYRENFILINQEYIMREFIERHTKAWTNINKRYDNDVPLGSLSMSNMSFASTNTSQSNSRTESRLDSISSDKNTSITQGSDYSDFYLNEIFVQNLKKSADPSRLAASHEYQLYKQKCRNVNNKINEICDLYGVKRLSTDTRSNATDDYDDIVFTRPISAPYSHSMTPSCSSATPPSPSCRETHPQLNKSKRTERKPSYLSESLDEDVSPPKRCRTPNSSCSTNSFLSPGRKYLYKHRREKTKEAFDRMFQKIWMKSLPLGKRTRQANLYQRAKKLKHSDSEMYRKQTRKQALCSSSLAFSDFTDEYDADLSDSDPNHMSSDDCNQTYPLWKSSPREKEDCNSSLGNNVVYKERHRTVNHLLIKQSKHLFTDKKTSYSDSEQVIKIQNVQRKVYTTIHHKVYDEQHLGRSRNRNNNSRKEHACSTYCCQGRDESLRHGEVNRSRMNTSQALRSDDVSSTSVGNQHTRALENKIQEIKYDNLCRRLLSEEPVQGKAVDVPTEIYLSDFVVETDNEEEIKILSMDKPKFRIKSEIQLDSGLGNNISTNESSEIPTTVDDDTTPIDAFISNESIQTNESTSKLDFYEHIKEDFKMYAAELKNKSITFNKQTVLKLIKSLVKNKSVTFADYAAILKDLNINMNLNSKHEFMIKQVMSYTEQDERIMKQCFERLIRKYHGEAQSEEKDTNSFEEMETFESFKQNLNVGILATPLEHMNKHNQSKPTELELSESLMRNEVEEEINEADIGNEVHEENEADMRTEVKEINEAGIRNEVDEEINEADNWNEVDEVINEADIRNEVDDEINEADIRNEVDEEINEADFRTEVEEEINATHKGLNSANSKSIATNSVSNTEDDVNNTNSELNTDSDDDTIDELFKTNNNNSIKPSSDSATVIEVKDPQCLSSDNCLDMFIIKQELTTPDLTLDSEPSYVDVADLVLDDDGLNHANTQPRQAQHLFTPVKTCGKKMPVLKEINMLKTREEIVRAEGSSEIVKEVNEMMFVIKEEVNTPELTEENVL